MTESTRDHMVWDAGDDGHFEPSSRQSRRQHGLSTDHSLVPVHPGITADMVTCFEIIFDRESMRYYEGQELIGSVILHLKDDMVIETLTVDFGGTAVVDLKKKPPSNRYADTMLADDCEKYLNQTVTLYSRESSDIMVSAGRHDYPFMIQLPYNLPSTIVGDHGSIKYRTKAVIERPWQPVITSQKEFIVVSVVDLNNMPQILTPVQCHKSSNSKVLCCSPLLWPKDNYLMVWRLDRTGFVPGEKIRINGEIHNDGVTRIRKSTVSLIQHIQYLDPSGHPINERKQIVLLQKGGVKPGHIGLWREELEIPPLPPTGLKGCSVMNLWYTIKMKILPKGVSKPLETFTEITIGTVPLTMNNNRTISTVSSTLTSSSLGNSETKLDSVEDYNYFV